MSIIKKIKKLFDSINTNNIEPMRQETHTPKYVPPLVISGVRKSPRMRYKRK